MVQFNPGTITAKADWEKKLKFYQENGFQLNVNLFTTTESESGGIDSITIENIINEIMGKL